MKFPARLLFATIVLSAACCPLDNGSQDVELSDPELAVKGLASDKLTSNVLVTIELSSKSKGAIDFSSSEPSVAKVFPVDRRVFKISTGAPYKDTPVTIRFTQDPKGIYSGAEVELKLTVISDAVSPGTTLPQDPLPDLDGVKVTFAESTEDYANPERGIYKSCDFNMHTGAISASEIKAARLSGISLWYMGFYLSDFMDGDISPEFFDLFQSCMDALRQAGSKCILRFAYTLDMYSDDDKEPEVDIVLRHVEQLKPYLQRNEDVIFVQQAGFVGPWGEWHTSTHFTDSYSLRRTLMDALLNALPASRQIMVRTPQFKMRMYDLSIADTLTATTAHDGSFKSRIAGHNDCFGANVNDYGTFDNEPEDREYWKAETRYTIMGGETCNLSAYCTCDATLKDIRDYHWTALNQAYNTNVINRWKTSGCYDEIATRIGYRLVMRDLFHSESPSAENRCSVTLRLYNTGVAAPMNPRDALLVWVSSDGSTVETPLGSDPRTWHSGLHVITAEFTPSSDRGTLYLKLSDPLLRDRPEYSIALSNEGVFDPVTGLNKLFEI